MISRRRLGEPPVTAVARGTRRGSVPSSAAGPAVGAAGTARSNGDPAGADAGGLVDLEHAHRRASAPSTRAGVTIAANCGDDLRRGPSTGSPGRGCHTASVGPRDAERVGVVAGSPRRSTRAISWRSAASVAGARGRAMRGAGSARGCRRSGRRVEPDLGGGDRAHVIDELRRDPSSRRARRTAPPGRRPAPSGASPRRAGSAQTNSPVSTPAAMHPLAAAPPTARRAPG